MGFSSATSPSPAPFELTGQTALITGGGSGLGLGMARCLAACGAKVILVGRNAANLGNAAATIGPVASAEVFDITDLGAVPGFARRVFESHGPVDILINNAGVHLKKPAEDIADDEFRDVQTTHVNAAFALSREFGRPMLERGSGSILFIASMASLFALPFTAAYASAKSAHLGIVRTLAAEWGARGVRVNALAPGWIHSEMMHKAVDADPDRRNKILGRTPLRDFGDPEDIGWAAAFLCSPAAKFITGVCLPVDGGASIGF
jgi:NAD(P)-dependent dehydrogenase (short-subunit alcohol dehydrogenase family)